MLIDSDLLSHQRKKGSRRFSGTFTIIERENGCGDLDIRINADVELVNGNGSNGNRNRYPNNNYTPSNNNFGNAAQGNGNSGTGGYAGQYNY